MPFLSPCQERQGMIGRTRDRPFGLQTYDNPLPLRGVCTDPEPATRGAPFWTTSG